MTVLLSVLTTVIVAGAAVCPDESATANVESLRSIHRISWQKGGLRTWDENIEAETSYYSSLWITPAIVGLGCIILISILECIPNCMSRRTRRSHRTSVALEDVDIEHKYDEPLNLRYSSDPPPPRPPDKLPKFGQLVAVVVFLLCGLGVCAATLIGTSATNYGISTVQKGLGEFEHIVDLLFVTIRSATTSTREISLALNNSQCTIENEELIEQAKAVADGLTEYLVYTTSDVKYLPNALQWASHQLVVYGSQGLVVFLACLAGLLLLHLFFALASMICAPRSNSLSHCVGCTKISMLCVMLICGFFFFGTLLAASDFCMCPSDTTISLLPAKRHYQNAIVYFSTCARADSSDSNATITSLDYDIQQLVVGAKESAQTLNRILTDAGYYNTSSLEACAAEQAVTLENNMQLIGYTSTLVNIIVHCVGFGAAWDTTVSTGICRQTFNGLYIGWISFYTGIVVVSILACVGRKK